MKIKAKIDRLVNHKSVKAVASVTLDGCFVVKNLRVVDGDKGLFVSMPQESYPDKEGNKKYSNLFFPITNAAKMDLRSASGNVKIVNLSSNIGALVTSAIAGKVLAPIGLIAAVFSIAGHYLGAGVTIKNGAKIVKPVIFIVLGLLAVKVLLELIGI